MRLYRIKPTPAPRQSRRDTWNPTPMVVRYRAFKDLVRLNRVTIDVDHFYSILFAFKQPKSFKNQAGRMYTPHRRKPDKDNLEKALLDALFTEDCHAWHGAVTKIWAPIDAIVIADHLPPTTTADLRAYFALAIDDHDHTRHQESA